MSQRIITPWLNTNVPGAFVNVSVISTASGLATSGVIVLMGEAAAGPDYSVTNLKTNFFGPQQGNLVRSIYGSGPIVDAFNALAAPSKDPDISGTASSVYILKTNKGTEAHSPVGAYTFTVTAANATVGATYSNNGQTFVVESTIAAGTTLVASGTGAPTTSGTLTKTSGTGDATIAYSAFSGSTYGVFFSQNYGVGGNGFSYTITSLDTETPPQVTGTTVPAFGAALNGDTFTIRQNGGATDVITLSSSGGGASAMTGQSDALAEYNTLEALTPTPISSTLGGQTLVPGTYSESSGTFAIAASGTLTLNGAGTYVFQCSSTLVTGAGATIALTGGATAANVFFQVGSSATLGATNTFNGNIIANTSVTLGGGTVNGSVIALNGAVTVSVATNINAQASAPLGVAGEFGLLGATGVTNTGATVVHGDVGSYPTNSITGFPPGMVITNSHANIAELIVELNSLLPAGITASAGVALNTVVLTMAANPASYAAGYSQSFELIDSTPGDLAALGLPAGNFAAAQEPAIEVQTTNTATGFNSTIDITPAVALTIGYLGTTGTVSVNATTLTTSVTGGTGGNLSATLSQYSTVGQLAAFINAQPGYSATATPSAISLPPSSLDQVSAIGIATSTPGAQPGRIKDSAYEFQTQMAANTALSFTPIMFAGIPFPSSGVFLSGGTLGPTLAIDIVNAISQLAGIQCNIIVPLFSQDATADILAGNTDPASTYTIDAINELLKTHCLQFSTPVLKKNRMAGLSFNGTYAQAKAQAQGIGTYRCYMTDQQVTQVNSFGVNTLFQPWYAAVIAAGMQAGGFYKSICNHYANIVSITDPAGYDNGDPFDVSDALTAGLLVLSQDVNGIKWVSDQTTYGLDANFVYNSIQAVYLSDILALDLGQYFQQTMVGKSLADLSAASALSALQQRFSYYKSLKMITTSNSAPLGYKNASIQIAAPSMFVSVEAALTTSLYFVAIDLALSAVQQSAS